MGVVLTDAWNNAMHVRTLRFTPASPFRRLIGVGGIGTGLFFTLDGNHTLGRNESRSGRLLDVHDYCKLHIIGHYVSSLLGARPEGTPFHVIPIGMVGADDHGRRLLKEMAAIGMDVRYVMTVPERPTLTGVCFQYPDGSGGNITTRDSAADCLSVADVNRCEPLLSGQGIHSIALAVPEAPLPVRDHLLRVATRSGALRVASFTSAELGPARDAGMFSRVDLLALNQDEAEILAGESFHPDQPRPFLQSCATALRPYQPRMRLVVSVGSRGAFAMEGDGYAYCPAVPVHAISTAGAGDALLAGIIAALAVGMPFLDLSAPSPRRGVVSALDLGVLLAAYSVTSPHTIHPQATLSSLLSFAAGMDILIPTEMEQYFSGSEGMAASVSGESTVPLYVPPADEALGGHPPIILE
jgi:ribokinase